MTSLSDTPAVEITGETVVPFKRGRGRPTGVKNGEGVTTKKKPVKKPRVRINVDAIVANGEVKKLKAEVERLTFEFNRLTEAFNGAKMHIESVEKKHKAALIVIGYLEGKIFRE
jgi:hypothetical protein